MASMTFAMEAVIDLASRLGGSRPEYDIRLEAAAAKEYCTEWGLEPGGRSHADPRRPGV